MDEFLDSSCRKVYSELIGGRKTANRMRSSMKVIRSVSGYTKFGGSMQYNNLNKLPVCDFSQRSLPDYNLNDGFADYDWKEDPETVSLVDVLYSLRKECETQKRSAVDFVSFRNNLNKILSTGSSDKPYVIEAVRLGPKYKSRLPDSISAERGTIVLNIRNFKSDRLPPGTDEGRRMNYYGRSLESKMVKWYTMEDGGAALQSPPESELCVTYEVRLGGHKVILAAEIDGVLPSVRHSAVNGRVACKDILGHCAELKARKKYRDDQRRRRTNNLFVFRKYHTQSALVGTDSIAVAYHHKGFVENVSYLRTSDLLHDDGGRDFGQRLEIASLVLTLLQENVSVPDSPYVLCYNPGPRSRQGEPGKLTLWHCPERTITDWL